MGASARGATYLFHIPLWMPVDILVLWHSTGLTANLKGSTFFLKSRGPVDDRNDFRV